MKDLGLKEYLDACEHWFEMYEAFCLCGNFEKNGYIMFYMPDSILSDPTIEIGYRSGSCSYCIALTEPRCEPRCDKCLLYDIGCCEPDSPWDSFATNPSKQTAKNMLLAILERQPEDYKESDE